MLRSSRLAAAWWSPHALWWARVGSNTSTPTARLSPSAYIYLSRQLDFHGQELKLIDADLARVALECANTKRLMTNPQSHAKQRASQTRRLGRGSAERHLTI